MSTYTPPLRLRGIGPSAIRDLFDRAQYGSINLGLGEPDAGPPDAIRQTAVHAVERGRDRYTAQAGLEALRERIASDHPHLAGDAGSVVVTAGSQEAIYVALLSLVEAGDEVLLPDPGFVAYEPIVRMAGGRPVFYPLRPERGFAFDAAAFRRAVTPRTKVAVLNSPSNPTGRALTRDDLDAIAGALDTVGAYVLSDEIYRDLYFTEAPPPSIADHYPRTLVAGGLSKSMGMTGWRVGWLCAPAEVVASARALHGYVTTCASSISQHAALAAWSDEGCEARVRVRETYRARRDLLRARLGALGIRSVEPDGAFYVMANTRAFGASAAVSELLLAHGVVTVPGSAFGSLGEGFTRVSYCSRGAQIEEGVRRIGYALADVRLGRAHGASSI